MIFLLTEPYHYIKSNAFGQWHKKCFKFFFHRLMPEIQKIWKYKKFYEYKKFGFYKKPLFLNFLFKAVGWCISLCSSSFYNDIYDSNHTEVPFFLKKHLLGCNCCDINFHQKILSRYLNEVYWLQDRSIALHLLIILDSVSSSLNI